MSHSLKGGSNKGQPFVKFESRSSKRGTAIVGQGATHGQTLLAKNGSLVIGALLDSPLNGADTPPLLFQLLFGMTICLVDGFGSPANLVQAELV